MHVKDGHVKGFINSAIDQTIDIKTFDTYFSNNDCSNLTETEEVEKSPLSVLVSPNPFSQDIRIKSNNRISKVQLYDLTGRLILEDYPGRSNHDLSINLHWTPGMYLLRIIGDRGEEQVIKIIKS